MYKYMEEYRQNLASELLNSEVRRLPSDMQGIDITDEFQKVLEATHDEAIAQKETHREVTNSSVKTMKHKLSVLFEKIKGKISSTETSFDDIISLATSYCNMGIVYKDGTTEEDLVNGQSYLKKCLDLLNGKELDPRAILLIMRASVQLDRVFCQLNEAEKCCSFSHKAIGFYLEYTKQGSEFPAPIVSRLSVNLDIEEACSNTMLSLVTLCSELLYHINNCECDTWDVETLVKPMHNFFMNQWIEATANPVTKGYAWASATVDFSRFFINQLRLSDTRNYLAAAEYILDAYKEEVKKYVSGNFSTPAFLNILECVATRWSIFGNKVLLCSKYNLFNVFKNVKVSRVGNYKSTPSVELPTKSLIFTDLEVDIEHIVSKIPLNVSNLDDVVVVCDHIMKWFEMFKTHVSTEIYNSSFMVRTLCLIEVGNYLTYFEADKVEQMKCHKERIEFLINEHNFISSKDKNVFGILHLHCNFQLMLTYGKLLDMILEDAEITEKRFEDVEKEVHNYVQSSAEYSKKYLEELDFLFSDCEKQD
ncbi:hypothetical protein DMN91_000609 [Ooceraea biroi]|uniref:Uncharacterized protein n=1 Tax=Ooceraea biroi TaxID=2015173 RepID=A0A026W3T1_OOCBI|nr:uncharacterized protein LOC105283443 [Ooceraea biroi]EZA50712.1 hypothetical protein X777_10762 [Ooceraea biroi]RLU26812.1 hypothetical protein DMN91_000609 [Ooceraea biroi]